MLRSNGRISVVLGVDIGSTNTKVVALTADGHVVGRAAQPTPRGVDDPSVDARSLLALVESLVLEVCADRLLVHAIATAGVGEDGVLVDGRTAPLTVALAWFDPRRRRILRELRPMLTCADRLGVDVDASRAIVGWSWARRHATPGDAHAWISLTDFPSSVWTGTPFMSDTVAARTGAWDANGGGWIAEHVAAALGDASLLPRVLPAGTVVGEVRSTTFRDAGILAPGAVVVVGGHDHPIGGWAVDQLVDNAVLDSMGTAEVVVAQSRALVGRSATMDVAPGIRQSGSTLLSVAELSRNVQWAALDPEVSDAITAIAMGDLEPDGFVDSDAFEPGRRGGGRPRYTATAPARPHSRASAVLGALARTGHESVREVSAHLPSAPTVFVAGGWSRAAGWLRIKERVAGPARAVPEPEVTAVGAAMLAAAGVGWTVPSGIALGTDAA